MKSATPQLKPLIVAGIMSGTSADGLDIALCRISPATNPLRVPPRSPRTPCLPSPAQPPRLKLLAHAAFPYPPKLRAAIHAAMNASSISVADLARLQTRLSETYAEALATTAQKHNLKPNLIAIHGQTIYHQATPVPYLGKPLRCTWQIAEPALIAQRLQIPVVSNFRPADLAAGGQGAPLVPMLDYTLFQHATRNRLLLNLGGIANITALPAAGTTADVLAFDIGPANMLIDACMTRLYNKPLDRNGATAARGRILQPILDTLLRNPIFAAPPPKSFGREEFGHAFATTFLAACKKSKATSEDIVATATALTAQTILAAYRTFCWPHLGQRAPLARATELLAAGGGAHNRTLMRQLTEGFAALGIKVSTTATAGLPIEAKEAAAFALLGWLTWHNLPGNIPSATGATHPTILGSITHAERK